MADIATEQKQLCNCFMTSYLDLFMWAREKNHSGSEDWWTEIRWQEVDCQVAILSQLAIEGKQFWLRLLQGKSPVVTTSSICFSKSLMSGKNSYISAPQFDMQLTCKYHCIFRQRVCVDLSWISGTEEHAPSMSRCCQKHPTQADGQTEASNAYCCRVLVTRQSFNKCLLTMAVVHDTVAKPDFLLLSVLPHIMRKLVLLNS